MEEALLSSERRFLLCSSPFGREPANFNMDVRSVALWGFFILLCKDSKATVSL